MMPLQRAHRQALQWVTSRAQAQAQAQGAILQRLADGRTQTRRLRLARQRWRQSLCSMAFEAVTHRL